VTHVRGLGAGALAFTLALLALGGCSERAAQRGPVTIVFKHARILGPTDPVPGLLATFEARNPGVRVRAEVLPWNSDEQRQFLVVNLESGAPGFDVMMLDVIWVPEFARAGWLLDLTPRVPADELAHHFAAAAAGARWDGRTWALPWFMSVGLLYYRSDLLAKHGFVPPATWEELVTQAERIRAAERQPRLDGFLWQGKQYEGLVVNALEHLWANDTDLLGADGTVLPDPARAAEALAFMRRLIERGASPGWVTAADEELSRRAFGRGEAVFLRNWPYVLDLFDAPDSPVRGKVGIAPLPRHAAGHRGFASTGGAHLAIHAHTRHPDAAVALARFLSSEEAQRAMSDRAALSPTRVALYDDPALLRRHPSYPRIREFTLAGRPRPVTPYYLAMSITLQPELSAALVGVKPPARAVADARHSLDFLLHETLRPTGPAAPARRP